MAWSADTWSSLAFVVAGAWILTTARRPGAGTGPRAALGVLAVLVGVGSVVQHGPAPPWNPVVHDPPLLGAYALVAADAVADLTGRRLRAWWWLVPTLADVVLAALWPGASVVAQGAAAAAAVVAVLLRARARQRLRARLLLALAALGVGTLAGQLSHPAWHVLAATAIAVVAPTVGRRAPP
ncbi:hypothetical protein ACFQ8T_08340 [Isoptericola sp. NPDC056618]|uniref:hypothetical protein n=1 Tax=Isoptericola sp. NPDC056618 TaxID=3345878 RepID=UPI00368CAB7B